MSLKNTVHISCVIEKKSKSYKFLIQDKKPFRVSHFKDIWWEKTSF